MSQKSRYFNVTICIPNDSDYKKIVIISKISVLATDGSLNFSTIHRFEFPRIFPSQTISKISEAEILLHSDKYLKNGDLLMLCDFFISNGEVYNEVSASCHLPNKYKFGMDSHFSSSLVKEEKIQNVSTGQHMHNLKPSPGIQKPIATLEDGIHYEYLDKKYCDVILTAGNKSFPVHKSILCLKSPVFNKTFETDMRETANKKVDIDDLDSDTLRRFLLFLYTENLENLRWEIAAKLFYAADKYQVTSLKAKCSSFVKFHLSLSNVCEALQLADLHQDEDLKLACSNFILQQDAAKMFSLEEWKAFSVSNPELSAEILQKYFLMKN